MCPLGLLTSALSSRNLRADDCFHQVPGWRDLIAYFFPFLIPAMATHTINTQSQAQTLASNKPDVVQIECLVCTEAKILFDFPLFRLTTDCKHAMRVCLQCIRLSIAADLKNKHWQDIACPDCGSRLDAAAIEDYASPETRAKYESILTKHMLESQEGFRWVS